MWNGISFAHFMLGQYEQGRAAAAKALVIGEDAHTLSALIMNEVGSGRLDEARVIAGRLLKLRARFPRFLRAAEFSDQDRRMGRPHGGRAV
ncbi:hypothetical protein QIH80_35960 [Bradyrhizobium elkanii]|nr:hypothetical protein QIH80_35960 [Bradyrhizobium elkanii]